LKPGTKDSGRSKDSKRNVTVTEEDVEDENSVRDGSYMDTKKNSYGNNTSKPMTEVDETITSRQDMTPRTDRPTKNIKVPYNKGLLGSGRSDIDDKSLGGVSKYSAVVFTNPTAQVEKAKSIDKKTSEEDEYSEDDDFEDDFEPYETSNEGDTNNK
jgi:hypothetical protein